MRERKSLTSSEPSASVVIGIVRYIIQSAFQQRVSIYMCIVQVRRRASFPRLGCKDSGEANVSSTVGKTLKDSHIPNQKKQKSIAI